MKRVLSIVLIIAFFLILVLLILFKLFSPSQETSTPAVQNNPFQDISAETQTIHTDTPYRTAISCYTWYLQVYMHGATPQQISTRPEASLCFTGSFISQWNELIASTGADPILLSQDYGTSWSSHISVATIGQSVHSSDQQMTLGTGSDQAVVNVHIVQTQSGAWQIDSVSGPQP